MQDQAHQLIVTGDAALIARRYANALYELAQDQKKLDIVAQDLRKLKTYFYECPELRMLAAQPRLTRQQLAQAMHEVMKTIKCDELTANFLNLLISKRRLSVLTSIIDAFLAELAQHRSEYTANVSVASPLSDEIKSQLEQRLRELAGGQIHLVVREDKSLLGGLVIKVGSQLFDASVKSKLARLERQMKAGTADIHTEIKRGAA